MFFRLLAPAALGATFLAAGMPAKAEITLPEIGDSSRGVLSSIDEQLLGEMFLREIRAHLRLLDDVEIVSYVRSVGGSLAAAASGPRQRFHFYVVDAEPVNAFAGPGGIIGINAGLIALTESESELASVVAHEIAHVTQNHLARAVEASARANPLAVAGMIAALVLASQNAQMGQAAVASVLAGSVQRRLDFTRENEKEADRVGAAMLAKAGFDPRAMPTFFERLQQANRFYTEPPEFLSTHPVTVSRIAESRARAEQYPYKQHGDSLDYLLVRAKVSALLADRPEAAIEAFADKLERRLYHSEDAVRYGLAVALMRAERWTDARPHVEWLLERHPDRVPLLAAWGEILRNTGEPEKAETVYRETLKVFPHDTLMTERYAGLLLEEHRAKTAAKLLEDYANAKELTARMHGQRARAYDALNRPLEANAALAEEHVARGDIGAAIHQLRIALSERDANHYAAARAQARLEELEALQRQRARLR